MDWETSIPKYKQRRTRKNERLTSIKPYYAENSDYFGALNIPTLFLLWEDSITEIVRHLSYSDLLRFRRTCMCVKQYCDREIQVRRSKPRSKPSMRELFYRKYYDRYELDDWDYYYYKKRKSEYKCFLFGLCHKKHGPDALCYMNYWPYNGVDREDIDDDDILLFDTDLDILLNPKLQLSLLNSK